MTEDKPIAKPIIDDATREKMALMFSGEVYLPDDVDGFFDLQAAQRDLQLELNATPLTNPKRRTELMQAFFGAAGEGLYLECPVYTNWGCNTYWGERCYANFNLTLVDDYHTNYSDGSGQQFITLVSKSGATFYLVIDRNAKGQQTVHFMNLVDEADLLALMEEEAADAYTAEKEAAAQAELDRLKAEEEAKKAAEEAATAEPPKRKQGHKDCIRVSGRGGSDCAGGRRHFLCFHKAEAEKAGRKRSPRPRCKLHRGQGDFEIPTEDEPEDTGEEDTEPI